MLLVVVVWLIVKVRLLLVWFFLIVDVLRVVVVFLVECGMKLLLILMFMVEKLVVCEELM